jgi:SAM-dependent methyltransferase
MATDLAQVVARLAAFYGFAGKTVVSVGAGGGQLVDYAREAARVFAVDRDEEALARLAARVAERGWSDRFTLVAGDLLSVHPRGDVVLLEFCLHQMPDPERALAHAAGLAPDVVVIDHAPGSPWSWAAGEERAVEAGWAAVGRRAVRRRLDVEALQRFATGAELLARLAGQPPPSAARVARYRGRTAIAIPMPYRLALL